MITALGIPNTVDVLFLPSVPTGFRDTLLAQARLLVYTPINEHFGIVPVEAMRAGVPVLASNTGGPLETVVEGETGWLRDATRAEEWTDVMREVLGWRQEDGRARRMAAAARERVRGAFSLTAMGDSLEREIEGMLGRERRPFDGWGVVVGGVLLGVLAVLYCLYRL